MRCITALEAGFNSKDKTYTIRIKDEDENITHFAVDSLEEFTFILSKLGRKKVVLNLKNCAVGLVPRAACT